MEQKLPIVGVAILSATLFMATLAISLTVQSAAAGPVVCSKSGACAGTTFSSTGQPAASIGKNGNAASAGSILCAGNPAARLGPNNNNVVCSG